MKFLKVAKEHGENVRQLLLKNDLLSRDYPIVREGNFILFPCSSCSCGHDSKSGRTGKSIESGVSDVLPKLSKTYQCEIVQRSLAKRPKRHSNLRDLISTFVPPESLDDIITSFDIVGDIAIIEIPSSLAKYERKIGHSLLQVHKNLRAVFKKLSPMEGDYRVRRLKLIAGSGSSETVYKENGISMRLDLSTVYFSVRLANERLRIASLISSEYEHKGAEQRVLVLFAGVGPFALQIAKTNPNLTVVAIELNPAAVIYIKENIKLNKLRNIVPIECDARTLNSFSAYRKYSDYFDHVVMPLPKSAHEFLDVAFKSVKSGGMVHFYSIVEARRAFDEALEKAELAATKSNVKISIIGWRIVRPYSPSMVQIVLDFKVLKYANDQINLKS